MTSNLFSATTLLNKDEDENSDKVRLIAVPSWLRSITSKACVDLAMADYTKAAGHHHIGCGTPGGTEIAVHALHHSNEINAQNNDYVVLECDISNAYNTMSRTHLLASMAKDVPGTSPYLAATISRETPIYCQHNHVVWSDAGVQQGDPPANLAFDLGMANITRKLDEDHEDKMLSLWIHDDGCLAGPSRTVAQYFFKLKTLCRKHGMLFNKRKTMLHHSRNITKTALD